MIDERLHFLVRRLLRRPARLNYAELAVRSEVLVPERAGVAVRPAAIMLPGNINRARGTTPSTRMEIQKSIALGGPITHPATIAHTLQDVRIEQTNLYVRGRRKAFMGVGLRQEVRAGFGRPLEQIDSGLLISTHQGLNYFGDWLFENTSRVQLARDLGIPALSMLRKPGYGHAPRYEQLFGLDDRKVERAQVRELVVVDDWGHPPEKASRYHDLRDRVRRRIGGRRKGHGVYVVRGRSGQMRYLANEAECIEWAKRRDFTVVDPGRLPVDELLAELRDAHCVVGVEGSGLMHGFLSMAPDGFAFGIVAPDRFVVSSKEYADALDLPMALLVADQGDVTSFRVNLEELDATYELARAST